MQQSGRAANGFAAGQNFGDGFERQHIDRHAHQGQCKKRRAAHRINIGDRVRCSNPAEVKRVIHDRHEKVRRRNDGLLRIDLINRGVVTGFGADQKLRRNDAGRHTAENFFQDDRGNFATTTTTMGKLGKSYVFC